MTDPKPTSVAADSAPQDSAVGDSKATPETLTQEEKAKQQATLVDRLATVTFVGQILFLFGVFLCSVPAAWFDGKWIASGWAMISYVLGGLALPGGMIIMMFAARKLIAIPMTSEEKRITGYRSASGMGLFLLLFGLTLSISITGLIYNHYAFSHQPPAAVVLQPGAGDSGDGDGAGSRRGVEASGQGTAEVSKRQPPRSRWIYFLTTVALAMLGAVFHCCSSLRAVMRHKPYEFDAGILWSGLFFRVGQAVIFSMVIFLALWSHQDRVSNWIALMPLLGLLIGMFVDSGEILVRQFAQRFFLGVKTMLGIADRVANEGGQTVRGLAVDAEAAASETVAANAPEGQPKAAKPPKEKGKKNGKKRDAGKKKDPEQQSEKQ